MWLRLGLLLTLSFFFAMVSVAQKKEIPQVGQVSHRLKQVMASAALDASPRYQAALAAHEADRLASDAQTRGLEWAAEYQREGWADDFGDQPNAAQYLRLGTSFLPLWHLPDARASRRVAHDLERARNAWAKFEAAREVAEIWLLLAAEVERGILLDGRLKRLGKAVEIEEKRLEFGEVAENHVIQLRMEFLLCRSEHQANQRQQTDYREQLKALGVNVDHFPQPGDLTRLAELDLASLPEETQLDTLVGQRHGAVLIARLETAQDQAQTGLVKGTAFGLPEVQVEWEQIPEIDGSPSFDGYGVTLSVPLPWSKAGRERVAESRVRARAAEVQAAWVERRVLGECRLELRRASDARDWLTRFSSQRTTLEDTQNALVKQIGLGAVTFVEYIDGLSRLDEVRSQMIRCQMDGLIGRLRLAVFLRDGNLFPLPSEIFKEQS